MWPLGACKLTWLLYWNAGRRELSTGSWPTTPRPRTVSRVPDSEKMRQWRSRNCTLNSPKFSNRMQYRHWNEQERNLDYRMSMIPITLPSTLQLPVSPDIPCRMEWPSLESLRSFPCGRRIIPTMDGSSSARPAVCRAPRTVALCRQWERGIYRTVHGAEDSFRPTNMALCPRGRHSLVRELRTGFD